MPRAGARGGGGVCTGRWMGPCGGQLPHGTPCCRTPCGNGGPLCSEWGARVAQEEMVTHTAAPPPAHHRNSLFLQPPPPPPCAPVGGTTRALDILGVPKPPLGCRGAAVVMKVRDAVQGKGPQRRLQQRLDKRLERVAEAVGGGHCRLQMPLRLALGVRGTVAGHRLGALEGGEGVHPPLSNASLLKVLWGQLLGRHACGQPHGAAHAGGTAYSGGRMELRMDGGKGAVQAGALRMWGCGGLRGMMWCWRGRKGGEGMWCWSGRGGGVRGCGVEVGGGGVRGCGVGVGGGG